MVVLPALQPPKEAVKLGSLPFNLLKQVCIGLTTNGACSLAWCQPVCGACSNRMSCADAVTVSPPMQGLTVAVRQQLRRSGWVPLHTTSSQQQLLLSEYLAALPGTVVTAPRIVVELTVETPSRLFLLLQIGEQQPLLCAWPPAHMLSELVAAKGHHTNAVHLYLGHAQQVGTDCSGTLAQKHMRVAHMFWLQTLYATADSTWRHTCRSTSTPRSAHPSTARSCSNVLCV
jgi:hypothetical protein